MKTANCPSCAAPVTFRSAASILAVCEYCKSTLIRHDMELEDIGKMGLLLEDASPLQLRAEGRYKGLHFAIIGRIQLKYEQGMWNEWYLLFDNGNGGWLSEASGNYVITFTSPAPEDLPAFDAIEVGQAYSLHGQSFQVVNKESSTCIAGEGELPFKVGSGYEAPVVDLSNETNFATLDFSETPPILFLGEEIALPELKMTGLRAREAAAGKAQVKAFNCPNCAAPQEIHAEGTKALACGSCGSIIGLDDENAKILEKYRGKFKPFPQLLPLGSRGRLRGADYDVVGFLRRQIKADGEVYAWSEYLLYSEQENFRWLSEYQGHWNFIKPLTHTPRISKSLGKPKAAFLGTSYTHFQTATAEVSYVTGEFYWRISLWEQAKVSDYIAPPLMLSEERSGKEVSWSLGEYVEPEEIASAFKLKQPLPKPVGVYANQPSPHGDGAKRYWRIYRLLGAAALALQIGIVAVSQDKVVFKQHLNFGNGAASSITTDVFPVDGHPSNLVIRNVTDLRNNWAYLDMTLIEKDTGQSYHFGRELSYYFGVDGGESWSEGNATDTVVLSEIPAGNYYLQVEAEGEPGRPAPVSDWLEVKRDEPGWTNFFLTLLWLTLFPFLSWWRSSSFERQRWAESDYAPDSSSDDDD